MDEKIKNIPITVKSKLTSKDNGELIHEMEIITIATLTSKGNTVYLRYEVMEAENSHSRVFALKPDQIIINSYGETNTKIVLNPAFPTESNYHTPYGSFAMTITTNQMNWNIDPELFVYMDYDVDLSGTTNQAQITITAFNKVKE